MKVEKYILFLILAIAISCSESRKPAVEIPNQSSKDTVVGKIPIQEGNPIIKEAVYFLVYKNDTSRLRVYFLQNNAGNSNGGVVIDIYEDNDLSYREEMHELKLIFREASKDFALRSLKRIWGIPLSFTGDLAIDVTKQLPTADLNKPLSNLNIASFLLRSKLTDDLNELLLPYGKEIKRYVVEKTAFIGSSSIFKYNKIETPRSEIPAKILDAQIWVVLESKGG